MAVSGGSGSRPYGIAITPDGVLWFSESGVQPNTIVQFDPKTMNISRNGKFPQAEVSSVIWRLPQPEISISPAAG